MKQIKFTQEEVEAVHSALEYMQENLIKARRIVIDFHTDEQFIRNMEAVESAMEKIDTIRGILGILEI